MPASLRVWHRFENDAEPTDRGTADYLAWLETLPGNKFLSGPALRLGSYDLLPFQSGGLRFLRDYALLYDEPGVGKTLQAVAWMVQRKPPHLVVCPKAVIGQWQDILSDTGVPATIVNPERVSKVGFHETIVVDEAHMFKNTAAQRTKALQQVSKGGSSLLLLTGTPIINRPIDLWSYYLLLGERTPKQFWTWAQRYTAPFHNGFGWDFSGASFLDELREDMMHFALRREEADVLNDLPRERRHRIKVQTTAAHSSAIRGYDQDILDAIRQGSRLAGCGSLQSLRVTAATAKAPACAEWLANYLESGGKRVVVFSGFYEPLRSSCSPVGRLYTGQNTTDDGDREENKRLFEAGEIDVLGCTYGAGGYGLNLQCANTVVLLDLPWTPAEHEQAIKRVRRRGQTESVMIVTFLCGSIIEDKIQQALDNKEDVIAYLEGKGGRDLCALLDSGLR